MAAQRSVRSDLSQLEPFVFLFLYPAESRKAFPENHNDPVSDIKLSYPPSVCPFRVKSDFLFLETTSEEVYNDLR